MSDSNVRYAVAYGLKGFGRGTTHLRVVVERETSEYVWVRTHDRKDKGSPMVLSPSQIVYEDDCQV